MSPAEATAELLHHLGVTSAGDMVSRSPIDGAEIGRVTVGNPAQAANVPREPSPNGARFRRRAAASWSACSAKSFGRQRAARALVTLEAARSSRRASARSRR